MQNDELIALAERCEAATGPTKPLDRDIALAVGWVRQTPSEGGRRHPSWFHPDDCRDGKVIMDSLHGTDVWRDPIAYTASIDAAMTLVPEGWPVRDLSQWKGSWTVALDWPARKYYQVDSQAATAALALCAAALRARAQTKDTDHD